MTKTHDKIWEHLSAFGIDVSDMSDADIDAGAERVASGVVASGVTAQQMHEGLLRIGRTGLILNQDGAAK